MVKQCRKPKNKNLVCCKQGGDDDEGPDHRNIECAEKPKNIRKCNKNIQKWTRKGTIEKECRKLIAKWEKKNAQGKKKMKKCVCTCLKRGTLY